MKRILMLIALLCCVAPSAQAAIMRDDVASSAYEAFASDPRFDSVGWLLGSNAGGPNVFASGVLVAPSWVLTSAHNIDGPNGVATSFRFSVDNAYSNTPQTFAESDALYVYPGWSASSTFATNIDLGLIHLSTPITSVAPADRFFGTDLRNTLMFTDGFGQQGTGSGGLGIADFSARAGSVVAQQFASDAPLAYGQSQYWSALMVRNGFPLSQPLEWQTSPGDSGGGWFADTLGNGSYQLVGIDSYEAGGYGYGGYSGALRVSLFNDWIDGTMATVPEPGSVWLLASGALFLVPMLRISRRKPRCA